MPVFVYRRVTSVPYARRGTGRASSWYGGRVCSIKVSVVGPSHRKEDVRGSLIGAPLTDLNFIDHKVNDYNEQDRDSSSTNRTTRK